MLKIRRPVRVYAVLTEFLRQKLLDEFDAKLRQLEKEKDELSWRKQQLVTYAASSHEGGEKAIEQRFAEEYKRLQEACGAISEKRAEVVVMVLGSEILHSQLECEIEVAVGDLWEQVSAPEIIIEDGIIIAIRGLKTKEQG